MTKAVRRDPLVIAAGVAGLMGAALALWPAPARVIVRFAPPVPATEPSMSASIDLTHLAKGFDHVALPAPAAPIEPPPDPAAALKRYRYLGHAAAEGRSRALFDDGAGVRSLAVGETLADFALTRIEPGAAVFMKDRLEVALSLQSPP